VSTSPEPRRREAGPLPRWYPGGSGDPPNRFRSRFDAISTTLPGSSAATVNPWTELSEPTADREVSQDSARARAVVTVSGGGTAFFPCSIIVRICMALTAASTAMTIIRPRMAIRIRFSSVCSFSGSGIFRFTIHHPPPRAWKSAAVSANRRDCTRTRRIRARKYCRCALSSDSWLVAPKKHLLLRDLQGVGRRGFRIRLRPERHGVVFQRPEHVGHVAERLQDRFAYCAAAWSNPATAARRCASSVPRGITAAGVPR